jgi:hypothetical protein
MSGDSSRRSALAEGAREADESLSDAPVGGFVDPCPADLVRIIFDDPFLGPARRVHVTLAFSSGPKESRVTDFRGGVTVKKARGTFADASYARFGIVLKRRVFLRPEDAAGDSGAWQRLVNLGYALAPEPAAAPDSPAKLSRAVRAFQADFRLPVTGELDGTARERLEKEHADLTPWEDRSWLATPEPSPEDLNLKGSLT